MNIIKNIEKLTTHGNIQGRQIVLEILEAGLRASDPYENTKELINFVDGKLMIGREGLACHTSDGRFISKPLPFDLSKIGKIFVVGGGKAAQRQAKAIEDVLGDLISEGHINAKKGEKILLNRIGVTLAGHPIPDEDSVKGSIKVMEIEKKARKDDIVFFSESGGASALMALPAPGVTLQDIREVTRKLYFECGASMWDTNAVRWNLMILRGKDERYIGDATLIEFHTDERPQEINVDIRRHRHGTGFYEDAISVLKKYKIWDIVPNSIRNHLEKADPQYGQLRYEEVKGKPHYHFRVMGPEYMLEAATKKAAEMGINATIIASSLSDIEAWSAGEMLAYVAKEVEVYGRPFTPPCVFICGGELLVKVGESKGVGGRNQEFVLSTASRIAGSKNIVIASVDSDGADGPTDAAGGIVDGYTLKRTRQIGMDLLEELDKHNSYEALKRLKDNIFTGVRGTNVQDLRIVYVGGRMKIRPNRLPEVIRALVAK